MKKILSTFVFFVSFVVQIHADPPVATPTRPTAVANTLTLPGGLSLTLTASGTNTTGSLLLGSGTNSFPTGPGIAITGGTLNNTGVLSFNGQTGAAVLTGTGSADGFTMTISGSTFSFGGSATTSGSSTVSGSSVNSGSAAVSGAVAWAGVLSAPAIVNSIGGVSGTIVLGANLTMASGTLSASGGGGSQTPWTGTIDGSNHALTNAGTVLITGSGATNGMLIVNPGTVYPTGDGVLAASFAANGNATQVITQAKQAQLALDAEMVAAEEKQAAGQGGRGALGARGARGMLGGLMGDAGFQIMGGAFLFEMINRQVDKYVEGINKAAEAQIKLNEERSKFQEEISKIESVNALESARAEIEQKINSLSEERSLKEGEAREQIDGQIDALQGELAHVERIRSAVIDRQEKEQATKEALREQEAALEGMKQKYEDIRKATEDKLKLEEKLEEIKLGADIAAVNRAERDGVITHELAEKKRQNLKNDAEKSKYDQEQAESAAKIKSFQDEAVQSQSTAGSAAQNYDYEKQRYEAAQTAKDQNEATIAAADKAEKLAAELRSKATAFMQPGGTEDLALKAAEKDASDKKIAADAARAAKGSIDAEATASTTDFESASKYRERADAEARRSGQQTAEKIAAEQQAMRDRQSMRDAEEAARGPRDADRVIQAAAGDKKNADQKEKEKAAAEHANPVKALTEMLSGIQNPGSGTASGNALEILQQAIAKMQSGSAGGVDKLHYAILDFAQTSLGKFNDHDGKLEQIARDLSVVKSQIKNNPAR